MPSEWGLIRQDHPLVFVLQLTLASFTAAINLRQEQLKIVSSCLTPLLKDAFRVEHAESLVSETQTPSRLPSGRLL